MKSEEELIDVNIKDGFELSLKLVEFLSQQSTSTAVALTALQIVAITFCFDLSISKEHYENNFDILWRNFHKHLKEGFEQQQ